ncbi:hypothetical protein OG819_50520 [Streptomyces sp. NBC_01549]|uniref:hypothetical protein n=1 Tax=Streptomyces sp. NBC_01549 TaxID=2975874 RepID=UPI00225581F8|nr:hypothetical protein [Streptomyces sp. NBC_01549]MCX4597516.1 hypothetical protein [Streptomyces sp. NBC_01549]
MSSRRVLPAENAAALDIPPGTRDVLLLPVYRLGEYKSFRADAVRDLAWRIADQHHVTVHHATGGADITTQAGGTVIRLWPDERGGRAEWHTTQPGRQAANVPRAGAAPAPRRAVTPVVAPRRAVTPGGGRPTFLGGGRTETSTGPAPSSSRNPLVPSRPRDVRGMATAHADRLVRHLAAGRNAGRLDSVENSLTRTALLMKEGDIGVVQAAWDRLINLISQAIRSREFDALTNADTLRAYKLKLIQADLYSKEPVLRADGVSARWWSNSPLQKTPLDAGSVFVPNWTKVVSRRRVWHDPDQDFIVPAVWRGDRVYLVAADHDVALGRVSLRASGHDYWLTRDEFVDVVAGDPLLSSAGTVVLAGHHTATDFLADQIAAHVGRTVYGFTGSLSQRVRAGRTFLAPIQTERTSLTVGTWARYKHGHQTEQSIRQAAQRLSSYMLEPLIGDNGEVYGYHSERARFAQDHTRLTADLRDVWIAPPDVNETSRFEYSGRVPWDSTNTYFIALHGSGDSENHFIVQRKFGGKRPMNGRELAQEVLLQLPASASGRSNLVLFSCHTGSARGTRADPLRNKAGLRI